MSLDLSGRTGRAHNTVALADADFSGVVAGTFNSGDLANAGKFLLQVDLTANAMDVATMVTTLVNAGVELFVDGVEMTIVKTDTSTNGLTFADPITGITYNYVDRQGESFTIILDTSTGTARWVAKV